MNRIYAMLAAFAVLMSSALPAKTRVTEGYVLPNDKQVTILILRPDVKVGELTTGGVEAPNAEWTALARVNIAKALDENQKASGNSVKNLEEQSGEKAQIVDDYQNLFRAVSDAVFTHKFVGARLPTKKDRFDWTLGPGAAKLGELGGGNYALLLYSHDSFGTAGRKALQAAGIMGCMVGACVIVSGGRHFYYASLVDLQTGNLVWFNYMKGSEGDIRTPEGAKSLVDKMMETMPRRVVSAVEKK